MAYKKINITKQLKHISKDIVKFIKEDNILDASKFVFHEKYIDNNRSCRDVFVFGDIVIKGYDRISIKCNSCNNEKIITLNGLKNSLRNNFKEDYLCNKCCNTNLSYLKAVHKNTSDTAMANWVNDYGELKREWLYDLYIDERKSLSQISQILVSEYKTNNYHRCISYIKKKLNEYDIPLRKRNEWLKIPSITERNIENGKKVRRGLNDKFSVLLDGLNIKYEREYRISNKPYDFYIEKYNLLIELNGTYWHCDPRDYDAQFFHKQIKLSAKDIWKRDKIKLNEALNNGFNTKTIWEKDFYNYNTVEDILNGIPFQTLQD